MKSKLGQLIEISAKKVSASEITYENYISTENMLPNCGGVTTASSIPQGTQKACSYEAGDTLFSNIRTYFRKVWRADRNGTCSADVLVFSVKNINQLDKRFLYYLVSSPDFVAYTDKTSKGAKMPRGDKDAIKNFEFNLPSIEEQKEIAESLGSLDDRITLLRETNKTLEAIAQAIFKSWFIDFEPVRAKMEGRIPAGLDEETAALFPDELVESELGLVPKGWDTVRLDSFLELAYGKALRADSRRSGSVPVYGSGGITGWHDTALVNDASVVVGRKGTVGRVISPELRAFRSRVTRPWPTAVLV